VSGLALSTPSLPSIDVVCGSEAWWPCLAFVAFVPASSCSRSCRIHMGAESERPQIRAREARTSNQTSRLLRELLDDAPPDHFTLGWLMTQLGERSFGTIMLLLALVALAPGISVLAGALTMIPACQLIAGRSAPVFPRSIAARPLPTRHLASMVHRAIPLLRHMEKIVHPRMPTPFEATRRIVGVIVLLLSASLVFTPIPLSNIVPALVIALISLAYLQEDGLLLAIALIVAVIVLAGASAAVWNTVVAAKWITGMK
jgi:hypothetical protein